MKSTGFIVSRGIDIWGLSLSSIIVFYLLKVLDNDSFLFLAVTLAISVALDNGHVYMSYSRVAKEFKEHAKFFVTVPVGIFLTFFVWMYFNIPYFWNMVLYATFFHFIRQIYGINRWYMRVEGRKSPLIDTVLLLSMIIPILSMSFNPYINVVMFTENDFFKHPSAEIYNALIALNVAVILVWIGYEAKSYLKGDKPNPYRLLYTASHIALFSLVGYTASNATEVIIPIMMAHGFQYLVLSAKMENELYEIKFWKIFVVLLIIGVVFGGADTLLQEQFDMDNSYLFDYTVWDKFALSLLLVPLFSHYIYDMIMWKSSYIQSLPVVKAKKTGKPN